MDMLESHGPAAVSSPWFLSSVWWQPFGKQRLERNQAINGFTLEIYRTWFPPQKNSENQFLEAHFHQMWIWVKKNVDSSRGFPTPVHLYQALGPACQPVWHCCCWKPSVAPRTKQDSQFWEPPFFNIRFVPKWVNMGRKMAITKVW